MYVCVFVSSCACVVCTVCCEVPARRLRVCVCVQTASTAVGSDFRFHFEKNEIGCIPTEARRLLQRLSAFSLRHRHTESAVRRVKIETQLLFTFT